MYAQEHLIRDRFSRYACVKCGACHTGDDVIVLARRGAAWLIMLTCTHCQRRGVYVVSSPRKRGASPRNVAADCAQLAEGTASVVERSSQISQSAMSEAEGPEQAAQGTQSDQLVALDQITPLDQIEQLEHAQYLDAQSSWAELWPEPLIDCHSLSLPSNVAENTDANIPESPDSANTSPLPTLPPPSNPQQPQPEWFSQPTDTPSTHPPFTPSASAAPPSHRPGATKRVTHADVDAIRSFLSMFNGDFLRLFGGANPGEQL